MIRLAARLRHTADFPIATAGFLNYSEPTFLDAVTRCVRLGATEIYVQPYFLISGYFVNTGVPKLIAEAQTHFPAVRFFLAGAFGFHKALVDIIRDKARAAEPRADALLLMAHGTPKAADNAPIWQLAACLQAFYPQLHLAFMECNTPTIAEAAETLAKAKAKRVVCCPYFLHLGGHVTEDLPEAVFQAAQAHPKTHFVLADYLSYDERLLTVIKNRLHHSRPYPAAILPQTTCSISSTSASSSLTAH